jgi:hypothetical protein
LSVPFKIKMAHQLLAYVDDVTILGDNTDAMKKNTGTSTDSSLVYK